MISKTIGMDEWILDVKNYVNQRKPSLNSLLDVHIGEAKFGREYISENLQELTYGSSILEVGAGSLLLSAQLMKEGFCVTALEPIGVGFSHFSQLQLLILELATIQKIKPNLISVSAENLTEESKFDFAFSINVMEHVVSVTTTIKNVTRALKSGATYRFTCPNYSFPYEFHFNIPIFVNKSLTEILLSNKIYRHKSMSDPKGVWESLNWITVGKLKSIGKKLDYIDINFGKNMLSKAFQRLDTDTEFLSRRPYLIVVFAKLITFIKLYKLIRHVPVGLQPLMDCNITKKKV